MDARDLAARPLADEHAGADAAFRDAAGGRYVRATDLKLADQLLLRDGRSATVTGLLIRHERLRVYNLTVLRLHNYAVGEAGVLVHNAMFCGRRGGPAHRNKVKEVEKRLKDAKWKHEAGGSKAEIATNTPNGQKTKRYADLIFETPDGRTVAVQIGRRNMTNGRQPVSRERSAISDLWSSGAFDSVQFIEY